MHNPHFLYGPAHVSHPNNQSNIFPAQQYPLTFQPSYCTYGHDELVWRGPIGTQYPQANSQPYRQQPFAGNPQPMPPAAFVSAAPSSQMHLFSEMIQSSGIQTVHPPYTLPVVAQQPNHSNPLSAPTPAQPHRQPNPPKRYSQKIIFDGGNFPGGFLGAARRQTYCSDMPKVTYCEADRTPKLPGTPVLMAQPKDVRELFDQESNSQTKVTIPSPDCTTWIFRGIHVRLCETLADVKTGVAELTALHPEILGLDCEWYHKKHDTLALIQISSARHCLLIRVCKIGVGVKYPQELCDLLSDPKIVKVGAGVKDDAEKIEKVLGIEVPSTIDLNWLVAHAPMVSSGNFRRGLKKQALSFLHTKMVGEYGHFNELCVDEDGMSRHTNIACTNWEASRLSMLQILYAADDAIFSYMVFMKLYLSFDRKRPCPNFDDSVYTVQPKGSEVLERLRHLVDKPSWMPRHLREQNENDDEFLSRQVVGSLPQDYVPRTKLVQNDLMKNLDK